MLQYKLSKDQELTPELIKKLIEKHRSVQVPRFQLLDNYYHNKNKILSHVNYRTTVDGEQVVDNTKPNNKVAHPYANYITDTLTGYFMGEGVTYSSLDDNALEQLLSVLEYNDAADEDTELAKDMSIFGLGIELQYVDSEGMIRFRRIDPREVVLVYDDTLEEDLLYGIRYYPTLDILTDKVTMNIEVYSTSFVRKYTASEELGDMAFVDEQPHYFGICPISVFYNNEDELGDFESVITLIDAYDSLEADSLNDFEYFVDAYLCLTGLNADAEDIAEMKANRVILLDPDSDAKWLTKSTSDTNVEDMKIRLDSDIHKFAKVPDMSDESFAGNASGVAIKYKTMPMENCVAIKERKFKKALQRRIELIFNILSLKGNAFDWREIEIIFTRNLPTNDSEIAQMVSTLDGIVSDETLLAQIPFVTDVQSEIERLGEQKQANIDAFYNQDFTVNNDENSEEE